MTRSPVERGLVVTVASPGVYFGKPRPAVVVQADRWLERHPSITLCSITSTLIDAPLVRIPVAPSPGDGLRKRSQLMADKLFTVPAAAIGSMVGRLEASVMAEFNMALRDWVDLQ